MTAQPGQTVDLVITGFDPGLTGVLGVRLLNPDGTAALARTTVGIVEVASNSGTYDAQIVAPLAGRYLAVWDDGQVAQGHVAIDLLEVTIDGDPAPVLAGDPVDVFVAGFETGLAGTLGLTVSDANGYTVLQRFTVGVRELLAGSGIYAATLAAPPLEGDYTLTWDAHGETATDALTVSAARAYPWLPDVAEVGDKLRSRTRDGNGNELGTFTAGTRPTRDQVLKLITASASKVTSKIGTDIPESLWEKTSTVIALRAAMLVELSYFGDQIAAGRSPYNELKLLHDEEWKDLYSDWRDLGADLEPGTADDTGDGGLPAYSFPPLGPGVHAPGSELPHDFAEPIW